MNNGKAATFDDLHALVTELGTVSQCLQNLYSQQSEMREREKFTPADLAHFVYNVRRTRNVLFGPAVFDDSAWDMLIELFRAEAEKIPMSLSSLSAATTKPQTTAFRKLEDLIDAGLVTRQRDHKDRRRVLVQLTDKARTLMELLCEQAGRKRQPPIGNAKAN